MTYKHDTLIRAWLDGKTVQYRNGLLWVDMPSVSEATKMPHFYQCDEYRLKPIEIRVRLALLKNYRTAVVHSLEEEIVIERTPSFLRWMSDWEEYSL